MFSHFCSISTPLFVSYLVLAYLGPGCNRTCDWTSHGHSALIAPFVFKSVCVKNFAVEQYLVLNLILNPSHVDCMRENDSALSVCACICVCLPARDINLFNNCWCTRVFFVPAHHNNCKRIPSNVKERMAEWKNTVGQSKLHKFTCITYNDRFSLESNVLSINR